MSDSEIKREAPWRAGLRAARANIVPGLLLQALMVLILIGWFFHQPTHDWMEYLAAVKTRWGYAYSALAAIVAGALIPEALRIFAFQKGRIVGENGANLLFTIPFWCGMGLVVDLLYRVQAMIFGDEATLASVLPQVLVDQFLYNPLFAAPMTVWMYAWRRNGYRWRREYFTARFYRDRVVPTLFATWGVWIPVVTILYLLPEPVQIPLFALALSLWVIIYTWMSEEQ